MSMPIDVGKHIRTPAEWMASNKPCICRHDIVYTTSSLLSVVSPSEHFPISTELIPNHIIIIIIIHPSVAPNSRLTMSTTSSRHALDLEMSSGSIRRARPTPSPHSPLSPRSPVRDLFDGRVDRDYFGQKDDASDMKVSAAYFSRKIKFPNC